MGRSRFAKDVDTRVQRSAPGVAQIRAEELDHRVDDPLMFEARRWCHVQDSLPHLVPAIETFRPPIRQFLFAYMHNNGSHEAIMSRSASVARTRGVACRSKSKPFPRSVRVRPRRPGGAAPGEIETM
jgi:hypothetical protein